MPVSAITVHPSSRLARIRSGEQCSPYMFVASTARRHGGSRARVNGNSARVIFFVLPFRLLVLPNFNPKYWIIGLDFSI
jgi:hypothetical protein